MKPPKKLLTIACLAFLFTSTMPTSTQKFSYKAATLLADENTKPPINYDESEKENIRPTSLDIVKVI